MNYIILRDKETQENEMIIALADGACITTEELQRLLNYTNDSNYIVFEQDEQ